MLIPPKYFLTPKISEFLASIEASRQIIDSVQVPPEIELNIRRQSTLRSSLFSARIEGNPLTLEDLPAKSSQDQKKREVFNILKALNWIAARPLRDLTTNDPLKFHALVLDKISGDAGNTRKQVSAIFNSAGIAVYLPPRPSQIQALLRRLVRFINSNREPFTPVRAALAHFTFQKIHPFLDGNGRVGRLLLQAVLSRGGYGMKGLVSLEEYLDSQKAAYYQALEDKDKNVTDYLEFMLEALAVSAEVAKNEVLKKQETAQADYLLPRRAEIYRIIKDLKLVNFDTIKRRFAKVNERTLRYDLKKLANQRLIRKLGTTRGVYYEIMPQS